jgi:hypothetical protein
MNNLDNDTLQLVIRALNKKEWNMLLHVSKNMNVNTKAMISSIIINNRYFKGNEHTISNSMITFFLNLRRYGIEKHLGLVINRQ